MPLIRKDSAQPPPPSTDSAARALTSGSINERWSAARALASPDGVEALGAALAREESDHVREAIFTSLTRVATDEAVQIVLPHLRSDDPNLRTGALDSLRAMPLAVQPHLPNLLRDDDADVRLLACEIARGLPSHEATQLMCDVLAHDAETNVCASAVDVLAEVGDVQALPALEACAARFAHESFLVFSIKIAADRIRASANA